MLRFKCTDAEKDWWRPIDINGCWAHGIKWDLTSSEYVAICKNLGIDALFICEYPPNALNFGVKNEPE